MATKRQQIKGAIKYGTKYGAPSAALGAAIVGYPNNRKGALLGAGVIGGGAALGGGIAGVMKARQDHPNAAKFHHAKNLAGAHHF